MAKFEFFGMLTILRWSTERCVPGFWNCKNRFSNDRKFQRSRCADAARSGSRRNEILSENDFSNSFVFFFCVVPGSWNVQVTIANRRTNRWTRRNEQNWFRVPCCGVSLEGIRQPLGASCVAGRFIRRPQNQSQHTPWSPCVIVQFDRPLRQLSPAMKKKKANV